MVITTIIAASTVALGFGGYLTAMLGFGTPIGFAAGLIVILSLVNWWGIKLSARFNVVASSAETFGLILVVLAGAWLAFGGNITVDLFEMPAGAGLGGIMAASALVFFAYIGFEEVANIAEETKKPTKTVPRALLIALLISTALYILVSLSAVAAVGWEALSTSPAPLADAVQGVWGSVGGQLLSLLALFATANTVLITMITASRILYGMGRQRSVPAICARVGRRGTPYISVFLIGLLALATLALGGIKTIALLTDLGIFIVYLFVNLSLIWLRYTKPLARRPFRSPLNIGRFPLLAALGVAGSGLMLLYFEPMLLLAEAIIIAVGAGIYAAIKRRI
jgi:APA family basic amino acid/polyamine antiporter